MSTRWASPSIGGTIKAALERDNFTTAPLNLLTARTVPDDAAEIVIGGPTNPFLAEENEMADAAAKAGMSYPDFIQRIVDEALARAD